MFSHHNIMKLEINDKKRNIYKTPQLFGELVTNFLNNPWIKEEIMREIRKYFKMKENGNETCQTLWDAAI